MRLKKQLNNSSRIKLGRPSNLAWWQGRLNGYNWDGVPNKVVRFTKGIQLDYTNMRMPIPELVREDDGWAVEYMVKPEGQPIRYYTNMDNGIIELGNWWTIRLDMYHFHIYFRYRSWTKNLFHIAWD